MGTREQITEAVTAELRLVLMSRVAEEFGGRVADALMPLVEGLRAEAKMEALELFSVELAELRISLPNSTGSYREASARAWKRAAELRSRELTP